MEIGVIGRIMSEVGDFERGIDIDGGGEIGEYLNIDDGRGMVIGESCMMGNEVRVYEGVRVGGKSLGSEEKGNGIKGIGGEGILEDNVRVY